MGSTAATCTYCTRPTPDGALCTGCTTRLRTILRSVPDLVAELNTTLARLDQVHAHNGGGAAETPVMFKEPAARALTELRQVLARWAQQLGDHVATDPPPEGSPALARWLLRHEQTVRRHAGAGEFLVAVKAATERGTTAIDLPEYVATFEVGPCPELDSTGAHCAGQVWAYVPREATVIRPDDVPAMLRCRACRTEWDMIAAKSAGRDILARQAAMDEQMRKALASPASG